MLIEMRSPRRGADHGRALSFVSSGNLRCHWWPLVAILMNVATNKPFDRGSCAAAHEMGIRQNGGRRYRNRLGLPTGRYSGVRIIVEFPDEQQSAWGIQKPGGTKAAGLSGTFPPLEPKQFLPKSQRGHSATVASQFQARVI